ncbi:MAG: regulatory protein RecX [Eubacteriales bacterium]
MKVTQLVDTTKNKVKVYLNDEYYFWLTKKEVKKLGLIEGQTIPTARLNNIIENIVFKKAKSKALSLLKYCDRTEEELKLKLKKEEYADEIINKVIDFLFEYNFVNDYRYAENYIENKKHKRSKKQITHTLMQKGIKREIVDQIFEKVTINEEEVLINLIEKKYFTRKEEYDNNIQKLYQYFVRKGFNPTLVMKIIKSFQQN